MTADGRGRWRFHAVVAAQFFGSLADSALLIVAIAFLVERHAAAWTVPALRLFFYLSYVALAAFAGAVADALPKGRVLWATNLIKAAGCALLLFHVHPLVAYALVGLGAAAHSPAKYGILSELLPTSELVAANAWIEVSTVVSILLGALVGSWLIDPARMVLLNPGGVASTATLVLGAFYMVAALCAAVVRSRPASNPAGLGHPRALVREFGLSLGLLWRDPEARISLAVTSLFWAAAATLQFVVLRWATETLQLSLARAWLLQAAVATGMVVGAMVAARWVPLRSVLRVLPLGLAIGLGVMLMALITQVWAAAALLFIIGVMAGLFVVPMNALLQQRGQALMHAGQSISVQNFSENLFSLTLLAAYGALILADVPLLPTVVGLGLFVSVAMVLIIGRHSRRHRARPVRSTRATHRHAG